MNKVNLGTGAKFFGLALILASSTLSYKAWAQDLGFEADEVLSYDQLDIDGHAKKAPSLGDRIEQYRHKIEERNEDLVKRKIEQQRIEQEKQLGNQLKNIFGGGTTLDEVATSQAAPVLAAPLEPVTVDRFGGIPRGKVTPSIGVTSLKGEGFDYEASLSGNINAEGLINKHFGAGIALNYTNVDIKDINSGYYYTYFPASPSFERDMKYKQYSGDIFGKFYIVPYSTVSPYVGAGVGYNRSNLIYVNGNFPQAYSYYQGRSAEYNNSFFSGTLMGGTDIRFTKLIGMNAEFKYRKSFNDNSNANNTNFIDYQNGDQVFLNKLGSQIDNSHFASLAIGLIVFF